MTNLLGDSKFLNYMAYGLMLVIGLAVAFWLYRLFFGPRIRGLGGGRSRQPRLGVVDSYDLDAKRQLVLIRRDNTEHLIMIGGPNDVVIESALTRAHPAARDTALSGQSSLQSSLQPNFSPPVNAGIATAEEASGAFAPNLTVSPPLGANARSPDVLQDQMPYAPEMAQPSAPSGAPARVTLPPIKAQPSAIPSAPIPPRMPPMTRPVSPPASAAKPLPPKPVTSSAAPLASPSGSRADSIKSGASPTIASPPRAPGVNLKPEARSEPQAPTAQSTSARPKADAADEAIDALEQEMARLLNRPPKDAR